jgi:TPR repeat protein
MFTLASARLGNIKAQNAMSFYYQYGIGVEKNCMYSRAYLLSSVKKCIHLFFKKF